MRSLIAVLCLLAALPTIGAAQLRISTDKDTLNFTKVKLGFTRDASVRITNISDSSVNIKRMTIIGQSANAGEFLIIAPQPTNFQIDSGQGRTVIIRFMPIALGIRTALLDIQTDEGDTVVALIGEGAIIQPDILMQPLSIDFGTLAPGEFKDTTIYVIGGTQDSATIDWIDVLNDNGEVDFDVTPIDTSLKFPTIVHNGDTIKLNARFTAKNANGRRTGRTIMQGEVSGSTICEFRGAVGVPNMTFTPQLLDLGVIPQGTSVDTFITIASTGESSVRLQQIDQPTLPYSISGVPSMPYSLPAGDSLNVAIHFDATTSGDFEEPLVAISKNGALTGLNRSALLKAFVIPRVLAKKSPQPFIVSCAIDSSYLRTLSIIDTGNFPVSISGVACSDTDFTATYSGAFPDTISVGSSRDIIISFKPLPGSVITNKFCVVNILSSNRTIVSDTIQLIAQQENAQFAVRQIISSKPVANSNSIGIVSVSDLARYKLTSLDLEFSINPPDVAEIDTLNVKVDNAIYPNAVVTAGYDNGLKKYFAHITSTSELTSSPVIPFLQVPLRYYIANDSSAIITASLRSSEKDGCVNFADESLSISSAAGCGDQEIRNSLNNVPLLSGVSISPNPSQGNRIAILFMNSKDITLTTDLLDINGKPIFHSEELSFVKGKNILIFEVLPVASGAYSLHMNARTADGNNQDIFSSIILSH